MTEINRELIKQAARDQSWDEGKECEACKGDGKVPGGRRLIHTFRGGFGADWDLDSILEFVDRADTLTWGKSLFGPVLVATVGSDRVAIEIRNPDDAAPLSRKDDQK